MADAVARGDMAAYVHALALATLILPRVLAEGVAQHEGRETWQPLTRPVDGRTAIVVFTSLAGMGSSVFVGSYEEISYADLRAQWAGPATLLLVNPGSPIEGRLSVATIDRILAGDTPTPVADAEAAEARPPESTMDAILHDPEYEASRDEYIAALCEARVIVPTQRQTAPESVLEPDFPGHDTGAAQSPTIEVFTSREAFAAAYPDSWSVEIPFLLLMLAWPQGHALSVNPGTPVRMYWPADHVHLLARRAVTS